MKWAPIDRLGERLNGLFAHEWALLDLVGELLADGDWEGVEDAVDELVGCEARIDSELVLMDPAFRPWLNL